MCDRLLPNLNLFGQFLHFHIHTVQLNTEELQLIMKKGTPVKV